jgi:hypothetical protein
MSEPITTYEEDESEQEHQIPKCKIPDTPKQNYYLQCPVSEVPANCDYEGKTRYLKERDYYCPGCGATISDRTKSEQELEAEKLRDERDLNFYRSLLPE